MTRIPKRYRVPLAVVLVLLGTYLLVAAYTPGGTRSFSLDLFDESGRGEYYGAKISPVYVLLGVSCYMGTFSFYKNRDKDKRR